MRDRRECPECGALFWPIAAPQTFCSSNRCARLRDARHGGASERDKDARFVSEVMAAHHRIWPEDEMSKGKSGLSYLERHAAKHSKTSVPPDDRNLSKADKEGVADEAAATVREGARQAILLRDQEIAKATNEGLAADVLAKRTDAAKRAAVDAATEETARAAEGTFWYKFKKYMGGVGD